MRAQINQTALWDIPRQGPDGARPWGMPLSVWEAAAKRLARLGHPLVPSVQLRFAKQICRERKAEPWWTKQRRASAKLRELKARKVAAAAKKVEPTESPRWVEVREVRVSAEVASYGMRCMVQEGRLPGLIWVDGVGVVGVRRELRICMDLEVVPC